MGETAESNGENYGDDQQQLDEFIMDDIQVVFADHGFIHTVHTDFIGVGEQGSAVSALNHIYLQNFIKRSTPIINQEFIVGNDMT
jgi:hypothetical protein